MNPLPPETMALRDLRHRRPMMANLTHHGKLLGIRPSTPTLYRTQNITAHATLAQGTSIKTSSCTSPGQGRPLHKAVNVGRLRSIPFGTIPSRDCGLRPFPD